MDLSTGTDFYSDYIQKQDDCSAVFLNRRAAERYRALASIIPGRERFCWNSSF